MPHALFSHGAKLSKGYPIEADVWKHAGKSGLVVDVMSDLEKPTPRPVLDNDYEIKPCRPDPEEEPGRRRARRTVGNSTQLVERFVREGLCS